MNKKAAPRGFSLIEALATVAIIGIITFLALPNVVRAREDAERNMAVSRAESLNMAMASFVQARGFATAQSIWATPANRYPQLVNYLAYAPDSLAEFVPGGYRVTLPETLSRPLQKAVLSLDADGADPIPY